MDEPSPEVHEQLEKLKSEISEFLKEKPKLESQLESEKQELDNITQSLHVLEQKIQKNKADIENNKAKLQSELKQKQYLESQVIELEKILDLMRNELYNSVIQGSNHVTYVEPEKFKNFKKEKRKELVTMLNEKTTVITRKLTRKNFNEHEILTHIEGKAREIGTYL